MFLFANTQSSLASLKSRTWANFVLFVMEVLHLALGVGCAVQSDRYRESIRRWLLRFVGLGKETSFSGVYIRCFGIKQPDSGIYHPLESQYQPCVEGCGYAEN